MLVINRKENEVIRIGHEGHDVFITVVEIRGKQVKIGIEAPKEFNIRRENTALSDPKTTGAAAHQEAVLQSCLAVAESKLHNKRREEFTPVLSEYVANELLCIGKISGEGKSLSSLDDQWLAANPKAHETSLEKTAEDFLRRFRFHGRNLADFHDFDPYLGAISGPNLTYELFLLLLEQNTKTWNSALDEVIKCGSGQFVNMSALKNFINKMRKT